MVYTCLPWNSVPGYIYCGLLEYLQHFWYLIVSIFCYHNRETILQEVLDLVENKFLSTQNAGIESDDDKYYGLITYSNRLMFDTVIQFYKDKKGSNLNVCLTSFCHTGYNRILKWTNCNEYIIDFNEDFTLNDEDLDEDKISKCDIILVTHCFGVPFIDFKRLIDIGVKYNIPIYEDCVQIGYMGSSPYLGSKHSTFRSWSGGQDKIPISFGAGIGFVRGKKLRDELMTFIKKYPMDTKWQRCRHLSAKLPLILIYRNIANFAWFCAYFVGYVIYGRELHQSTMFVRKNWGGFVHGRTKYSKQCSVAQLLSIKYALTRNYHKEYQRELYKRQYFVRMCEKHLGEKQTEFHFPWRKCAVDYDKSSNFYYHFRVKEKESALKLLADHNFPTLPCQAWYVDKDKAPNSYKIKEQLLILPNCIALKDHQIENMAKVFVEKE